MAFTHKRGNMSCLKRSGNIFVISLSFLFLGTLPLSADWGEWGEGGLVIDSDYNGNKGKDGKNRQQGRKAMMPDGLGGLIVTWVITTGGSSTPAYIYAQRLDSDGNFLWGEDGILINESAEVQCLSNIIPAGPGEAIICWLDDDRREHPVAQKIDYNGTLLWDSAGVDLCNDFSDYWHPRLIPDGDGGAIVTVLDAGNKDIIMQRVDSDGALLWDSMGLYLGMSTVDNEEGDPSLASDCARGAIVVWADHRSQGILPYDIYAQRVTSSGIKMWDPAGVAVCDAPGNQKYPVIITGGDGCAFFTWEDMRSGGFGLYAQRLDEDGNALWQSNGIAVCTYQSRKREPVIISDGAGGVIIAWHDNRVPPDYEQDVYAQRIDGAGNLVWNEEGVPICNAAEYQEGISICSDGDNGAIVCWVDKRDQKSHVYAQRVDNIGKVKWQTDGIPICSFVDNCRAPYVCSDGNTGAFMYWYDWPYYATCYVQKIDSHFDFPLPYCDVTYQFIDSYGDPVTWLDFLRGCPGGDWDCLRVTLTFDTEDVPRDIEAGEITFDTPGSTLKFWNDGDITADSAAVLGEVIRTTITHSFVSVYLPCDGGCDECPAHDITVLFRDNALCEVESLVAKSIDHNGDGVVNLSDLACMGLYYNRCEGDIGYNDCCDFTNDGCVNFYDFVYYILHRCDGYPPSSSPGILEKELPESDVSVRFVARQSNKEEQQKKFYLTISLENAGDISTMGFCLEKVHPALEYIGWVPDPDFPAVTEVSPTWKYGSNKLYITAFEMTSIGNSVIEMGTLEFKVTSDDEISIKDSDLILTFGEILDYDERIKRIQRVEYEEDIPVSGNYLAANYPNPFNPATTIEYSIVNDSHVNLSIYDVNGRLVRTLVNEFMERNIYRITWDGKNNQGTPAASGVYFYRLVTNGLSKSKKLVLIR